MATIVGIAGNSGVGKSTSFCPIKEETLGIDIIGLRPQTSLVLKCLVKNLPVRNANTLFNVYPQTKIVKNGVEETLPVPISPRQVVTLDSMALVKELTKAHNDVMSNKYKSLDIIIDDFCFIQATNLIARLNETGYDKFKDTAANTKLLFDHINNMHPNIVVYFMLHLEYESTELSRGLKIKTSSKLIDKDYKLDSLFETLLYARTESSLERLFHTRTSGDDTCKSPIGMFPTETIPNDLGLVAYNVRKYYQLSIPKYLEQIPARYKNMAIDYVSNDTTITDNKV